MKHIKSHPINDKSQKLSKLKKEGEKFLSESVSLLTDDEKKWLESIIRHADNEIGFDSHDIEIKQSIYSKLGIS